MKKKLLKRTRNHGMWEVFCEYAAESVFVDHKPTDDEVTEIIKEHWKYYYNLYADDVVAEVYKLSPIYTKK